VISLSLRSVISTFPLTAPRPSGLRLVRVLLGLVAEGALQRGLQRKAAQAPEMTSESRHDQRN